MVIFVVQEVEVEVLTMAAFEAMDELAGATAAELVSGARVLVSVTVLVSVMVTAAAHPPVGAAAGSEVETAAAV